MNIQMLLLNILYRMIYSHLTLLKFGITIKIQKMLNWSIKRYYLQILKRSLEYGEYRYLEIKLKLMVKLMIE